MSISKKTGRDVGDLICGLLHEVYVKKPAAYRKEAAKMGVGPDSLAAAALTSALYERGYLRDPGASDCPSPEAQVVAPLPEGWRPSDENLPPLPELPDDPSLLTAIGCLVLVARNYRGLIRQSIEEVPRSEWPSELQDEMDGFDAILNAWIDHPDLDIEPEE